MPTLSNPKHEKFAKNRALGMSITESYSNAGYEPHRQNASRLMMTNDDIKNRIRELLGNIDEEFKVTRDNLNKVYLKQLVKADDANNYRAAKDIADSLARMNGLIVTRHESGKAGDFDNLTDYELLELIAEPLGDSRADDSE
jgi:phage terminase small subunit